MGRPKASKALGLLLSGEDCNVMYQLERPFPDKVTRELHALTEFEGYGTTAGLLSSSYLRLHVLRITPLSSWRVAWQPNERVTLAEKSSNQ